MRRDATLAAMLAAMLAPLVFAPLDRPAGAAASAHPLDRPAVATANSAAITVPRDLWLWYEANLADDAAVARLESIWRRAAASGYRHVMFYDSRSEKLQSVDDHYFVNVQRVKALAASLGLEIVPGLFTVGRANLLLARDPNRVEALPVKDAPFVVEHGIARALTDPPVALPSRPDFADPETHVANFAASVHDNREHARFLFHATVAPWRCYHVSVWIRTAQYTGQPLIQTLSDGQAIHFVKSLGARGTQDWARHDVVFNSRDHTRLELWFGAWKPASGTLEWKDWKIEEPGPVNLVRRPSASLTVGGVVEGRGGATQSVGRRDGMTRLVEGRDYDFISDPRLGASPKRGDFDEWHEPPVLRVRAPDGTRLSVSWEHAALVYNGQAACCLSDSTVMAWLADQAERVRAAWTARGYLMMHDEIRALGSDAACTARHLSPGQILAANARACAAMLNGSTVYVWNDMFDPFHNAVKNYHLVGGDLAGSWEGLDSSTVIVNWNGGRRGESLRFFAKRGHRQIIAGYYDTRPEDIRDWLVSARDVPNVTGVMYTTWRDRYDDLEAFAAAVHAFR